jgi:hypothetical protein
VVSRLAGEPIAVLCKHYIDTTRYEVANTVHTRPLKAGAALAGVCDLLKDLVPFLGGVGSQGFAVAYIHPSAWKMNSANFALTEF